MTTASTNSIEKQILIRGTRSRVWRALTDSKEFGTWFLATFDGPFIAGKRTKGQNAHPGYEHMKMEFAIEKLEPETYFSYRWHPFPVDTKLDYSKEEMTLVEFRLEVVPEGILLHVTESGFDRIPSHRRAEAHRMHEGGWEAQLGNVARYVTG